MTEVETQAVLRLRERLETITALFAMNPAGALSAATQAALRAQLADLHPADIAFILEALPLDERLAAWQLVKAGDDGDILLEVSDAVRESLIADMDHHEILAAAETLDADELADLVDDLPSAMLPELMAGLDTQQRAQVQSALSYQDDQLGALMDFEMVTIREDVSLEVVLRYLRRFAELPAQTDKLFVVNQDNLLTGVLPHGQCGDGAGCEHVPPH